MQNGLVVDAVDQTIGKLTPPLSQSDIPMVCGVDNFSKYDLPLKMGRYPENKNEVVIDENYAIRKKLKIGDTIEAAVRDSFLGDLTKRNLLVTGLCDSDLPAVFTLLEDPSKTNEGKIYLSIPEGMDLDTARKLLEPYHPNENIYLTKALYPFKRTEFFVWILFLILLAAACVIYTFNYSLILVHKESSYFRILSRLGISARQLKFGKFFMFFLLPFCLLIIFFLLFSMIWRILLTPQTIQFLANNWIKYPRKQLAWNYPWLNVFLIGLAFSFAAASSALAACNFENRLFGRAKKKRKSASGDLTEKPFKRTEHPLMLFFLLTATLFLCMASYCLLENYISQYRTTYQDFVQVNVIDTNYTNGESSIILNGVEQAGSLDYMRYWADSPYILDDRVITFIDDDEFNEIVKMRVKEPPQNWFALSSNPLNRKSTTLPIYTETGYAHTGPTIDIVTVENFDAEGKYNPEYQILMPIRALDEMAQDSATSLRNISFYFELTPTDHHEYSARLRQLDTFPSDADLTIHDNIEAREQIKAKILVMILVITFFCIFIVLVGLTITGISLKAQIWMNKQLYRQLNILGVSIKSMKFLFIRRSLKILLASVLCIVISMKILSLNPSWLFWIFLLGFMVAYLCLSWTAARQIPKAAAGSIRRE